MEFEAAQKNEAAQMNGKFGQSPGQRPQMRRLHEQILHLPIVFVCKNKF